MLNNIVTNGSICYGVDYTPSQTTTPSLSTMQYMELENFDYTLNASITKLFTESLDTMPIIIYITCNVNKSNILLQVTCHLYSISMNYFLNLYTYFVYNSMFQNCHLLICVYVSFEMFQIANTPTSTTIA